MAQELENVRRQARWAGSRFVAGAVDSLGGWPERLPDGTRTRVAFHCRGFARNYESVVVRAFIDAVKPGTLVLDIGAHWGLYSLLAARLGARVIAFEPVAGNRKLLARNLALGGFRTVEMRLEAITDTDGEIIFHRYEGPSWGKSMMGGILPQPFTRPAPVPSARLDSLGLEPDVIKLDVEGAEAAVLDGAAATILNSRPTIFLEVHVDRVDVLGSNADKLAAKLVGWEYARHELLGLQGRDGELIRHWLCVPAEKRREVRR